MLKFAEPVNFTCQKVEVPFSFDAFGSRIDDSAFLDIPPVIDHVLAVTKQPKLHLISISKGVTAVLELLASRTEYNEKVRICMLLSPVSYIEEPVLLVRALMNLLKIVIFFVSLKSQIIRFSCIDCSVIFRLVGSRLLDHLFLTILPVLAVPLKIPFFSGWTFRRGFCG